MAAKIMVADFREDMIMSLLDASKNIYKDGIGQLTSRIKIAIEEIDDHQEVLEIGVGSGELSRNIHKFKNVKLCAVDVSESGLKNANEYVVDSQLVDISNSQLKFTDSQFDVVFCLEVFEHLQNPYFALMEIQRVLKPGGKLVLSVPNYRGGHLMIYPGLITIKHFKNFLKQNYFKIIRIRMWGPVFNKDNVGKLLDSTIKNKIVSIILLRIVQVFVRVIQFASRILGLKISALYWCYFFICENKKGQMDKPLWIRQLEQNTNLKGTLGWYNNYFHRKVQ
jgi:ubiquinone/menaquinone biosynthesis C-methylase UbiE